MRNLSKSKKKTDNNNTQKRSILLLDTWLNKKVLDKTVNPKRLTKFLDL